MVDYLKIQEDALIEISRQQRLAMAAALMRKDEELEYAEDRKTQLALRKRDWKIERDA